MTSISPQDIALAEEHLDRAISFSMCGKLDQAIDEVKKALQYDSELPQAYNKLGDFYMKKGWISKAAEAFEKSISIDPGNENSHFDLGCALIHLEKYQEALESLKKALELKPKHYEIYGHIGLIHLKTGNYDKAIEAFLKARQDEKDNLMATFYLAVAYAETDQLEKAMPLFQVIIAKYDRLVNIKSRYAEGNYYIGRSYYYLKEYDKAVKYLKLAVEYDTEEIDYHYSFGMLYSDADAFYALAEALHANGQDTDASIYIKKALELVPDNQKFIELKNKIGA